MKTTRRVLAEIALLLGGRLMPGEAIHGELELDELQVELHIRVRRRASGIEHGRLCEEALAILASAPYRAERCSATTRSRPWPGAKYPRCSRPVAVAIAVDVGGVGPPGSRFHFVCCGHRDSISGRILGAVRLPAGSLRAAREQAERERAERRHQEWVAEQGARAIVAWLGSYRQVDELAERRARTPR